MWKRCGNVERRKMYMIDSGSCIVLKKTRQRTGKAEGRVLKTEKYWNLFGRIYTDGSKWILLPWKKVYVHLAIKLIYLQNTNKKC